MTKWNAPISVLLLGLALSLPVAADPASEAQLQFELAQRLYKEKRYDEAIERFVASNRLVPNANVVFNIGQTFEFLKRRVDAYNWYVSYLEFELTPDERSAGEDKLAKLAREVGVYQVTTEPAGAEVFVDRVDLGSVGRTPRNVAVPPGSHQIIVRLAGYAEAAVPAEVALGAKASVSVPLKALTGTLTLDSRPARAEVRLEREGTLLGVTPLNVTLPVGSVSLLVSAAGYLPERRTVDISEGQPTKLELALRQDASRFAVLTVTGNVDGASVKLDGTLVGTAPLALEQLPAGMPNLELSAPGREPWKRRVSLEPGSATRVQFHLVDPTERTWPGYRYLGYGLGGALFLTGAGFGLSALGEKSSFDEEPSSDKLDALDRKNLTADVLLGTGLLITGATLVWDLLRAPDPESTGSVSIDR